ncbi:MAG: hypothetical protein U1U88_000345 [Lawsonella clevelandensis]
MTVRSGGIFINVAFFHPHGIAGSSLKERKYCSTALFNGEAVFST